MSRHAELHSVQKWAAELGISERKARKVWVNLWERPSSSGNKGKAVDRLRPGARARILDETEDDYRVQGKKAAGWIGKVQIARVIDR